MTSATGSTTSGPTGRVGGVRDQDVSGPTVQERPGALVEAVDTIAGLLSADRDALAGLNADDLRDRMSALNRLEGLTTTALATTTRALSDARVPGQDGAATPAAWLQAHGNRSARDANRLARLAIDLDDLPETRQLLADGQVSAEAADVIIHAARDTTLGSPDEVDRQLAEVARTHDPAALRAEVKRRIQQATGDQMRNDERRQRARRRLSLTHQDDGMWQLYGLLPTESGDRLRTLLDVFDLPDPADAPPEVRRQPGQRLADALDTAVTVALDHADLPATGGVTRPHVSVIMDAATFAADLTDPDASQHATEAGPHGTANGQHRTEAGPDGTANGHHDTANGHHRTADGQHEADTDRPVSPNHPIWASLPPAELGWGGQISPQAARRICCDAAVARLVAADSRVLDVGRTTRVWSSAQRRAINARDRGCRGPNCNRPIAWTQIHHLRWWRHGGPTDLNNGLALCHHCHHLVHDSGWHVTLDPDTAAATWTTPDRRRTIVTHPRPPS